jgi:hypothetical protein
MGGLSARAQSGSAPDRPTDTDDDLIFIHHSCGQNWLDNSLHNALLAKDYIDERNDIYYGTDLPPDSGRPDSLASTPGDQTDMNHWVRWFNDYLNGVKAHGAATGYNKIIMFKSCYPNSNISSDGTEPGDPFSGSKTLANYKAVYRHPTGSGHTYLYGGYTYQPLEDIFAAHPEVLFIPVTAPPRHYAPGDATNDAEARRARTFNNWLKYDWLDSYNNAHPTLHNVAVFDWFDVLTYPDNHPDHPNRLRQEYGGATGDSHPNSTANSHSTNVFASNTTNFLDNAWNVYGGGSTLFLPSITIAKLNATTLRLSWSHDWDVSWYRVWRGTEPYFIPSGPTPRTLVQAAPWRYDDAGALGAAGTNYFYLVEDVLSDGILSTSKRVGEFDFSLTPGSS